jgi:hypothetical protein
MRIRFVRTIGAPDRVYVRRSDGSETSWSFPTYGDAIPHDMVHLVVEEAFEIADGFWGRVDRGVDPARINADANRTGGANKYAGFGDDLRELLLAETVANLSWGISEISDEERLQRVADDGAKVGFAVPPLVNAAGLQRVRERLAELSAQWRRLVPKGTLELTFAPAGHSLPQNGRGWP